MHNKKHLIISALILFIIIIPNFTQKDLSRVDLDILSPSETLDDQLKNLESNESYSSYAGVDSDDVLVGSTNDSSGYIYILSNKIGSDYSNITLSKFSPDMQSLVYRIEYGISGYNYATRIKCIDDAIIIGGYSEGSFPTTIDALYKNKMSEIDGLFAIISSNDGSIYFSTYIGGTGSDKVYDFISTGYGIYIVGSSSSLTFPSLPEFNSGAPPYMISNPGDVSGFVITIQAGYGAWGINYFTYLGGTSFHEAIRILETSPIMIIGNTYSSDFPNERAFGKPAPISQVHVGGSDIFMVGMHPWLYKIEISSFFGGVDFDMINDAEFHGSEFFLYGTTNSSNFPTTAGSYDSNYEYSEDVKTTFISRISKDLNINHATTFIGGSFGSYAISITLNKPDSWATLPLEFHLICATRASYPISIGAHNKDNSGFFDYAYTIISYDLKSLKLSTYISASLRNMNRTASIIKKDSSNEILIFGSTQDENMGTSALAFDKTFNSVYPDRDMFMKKISYQLVYTNLIEPNATFIADKTTIFENQIITFTFIGSAGNRPTAFIWDFGDGSNPFLLVHDATSPNQEITSHRFLTNGTYNVSLSITDAKGSYDIKKQTINVIKYEGDEDEIPILGNNIWTIVIIVVSIAAGLGIGIYFIKKRMN